LNFKKPAYPILKNAYKLLAKVIPQKKNRIGFISYPDATDNSWHLYNYMHSHLKDHKFIWFCSDLEQTQKKITNKKNTKIIRKNTIRGLFNFITCNTVFFTHGSYFFTTKSNGPCLVNLWHGMPLKAISYLDNKSEIEVPYCDYSISTSELYSTVISQAFGITRSQVLNCGLPRNDALISPGIGRNEALNKLGLDISTTFIFWLPTYRTSIIGDIRSDSTTENFLADLSNEGLARIDEAARKAGTHIIIKLHPMDSLNNSESIPELANIHIFKQSEWVNLNLDLYEALAHSSALITDMSSVMIDYITTEKPIGIFTEATNNYTRSIISNLDINELHSAIHTLNSEEDIINFTSHPPQKNPNPDLLKKYNSHAFPEYKPACQIILEKFLPATSNHKINTNLANSQTKKHV